MENPIYQAFLDAFNAELEKLDCGARVHATDDDALKMDVVDLDGKLFGRIPTDIEPETFSAFMLLVEQAFEDGVRIGRDDTPITAPTVQ